MPFFITNLFDGIRGRLLSDGVNNLSVGALHFRVPVFVDATVDAVHQLVDVGRQQLRESLARGGRHGPDDGRIDDQLRVLLGDPAKQLRDPVSDSLDRMV